MKQYKIFQKIFLTLAAAGISIGSAYSAYSDEYTLGAMISKYIPEGYVKFSEMIFGNPSAAWVVFVTVTIMFGALFLIGLQATFGSRYEGIQDKHIATLAFALGLFVAYLTGHIVYTIGPYLALYAFLLFMVILYYISKFATYSVAFMSEEVKKEYLRVIKDEKEVEKELKEVEKDIDELEKIEGLGKQYISDLRRINGEIKRLRHAIRDLIYNDNDRALNEVYKWLLGIKQEIEYRLATLENFPKARKIYEKLRANVEKLEEDIKQIAKDKIKLLRSLKEDIDRKLNEFDNRIEAVEQQIEELNRRNRALAQAIGIVHRKIKEAKNNLESKIDKTTSEYLKKIEEAKEKIYGRLEGEIGRLENIIEDTEESLRNELSMIKGEHNQDIEKLKQDLDKSRKEIKRIREELEELRKEDENIKKEIGDRFILLIKRITNLSHRLEEQKQINETLKREIEELKDLHEKDIGDILGRLDRISGVIRSLCNIGWQNKEEVQSLREIYRELLDKVDRYIELTDKINSLINNLQHEMRKLQGKIKVDIGETIVGRRHLKMNGEEIKRFLESYRKEKPHHKPNPPGPYK